jgi:ketosteroid isomerase-like protein
MGSIMTHDEIVEAYTGAIENSDPGAILELVAPGADFWHNFDDRNRDIAASLGEMQKMKESLDDIRFDIVERFAVTGGIGVRLVLRGTLRATGQAFASHQAKFFRIRDGKITRIEEYVAPARILP